MFLITDFFANFKLTKYKFYIFVLFGLTGLYFATRLVYNLRFPIFSDEGIYINWARIAAADPAWRFISLTDGKQPLQTWGTIPFIKLLPNNLLLAGRLFGIWSGYVALLGYMAAGKYFFGRRGFWVMGLTYVLCPYFVLYDRLALVDSMVNAGCVWIFLLSAILVNKLRFDIAIIFGVLGGVFLLAKSSALLFIVLAAFAPILLLNLKKIDKKLVVNYLFLYGIGFGIALSLYLTQKFFSQFFHYIAQKNLTFVLSLKEFLESPLQLALNNIQIVPYYVLVEIGFMPFAFGIIGIFWLFRAKKSRFATYLLLWILAPLIFVVLFNKVVFGRYLIFFTTLLIIPCTYFVVSQPGKRFALAALVLFVPISILSALLIVAPTRAILPSVDYGQYINGQTAVWGAGELMQQVRDRARKPAGAYILAEGNFGLVADVLTSFLKKNDKIAIDGKWPLDERHILEAQLTKTKDYDAFVVFSHRKDIPIDWKRYLIEEIATYNKPGNDTDYLYLYRVRAPLPITEKSQ